MMRNLLFGLTLILSACFRSEPADQIEPNKIKTNKIKTNKIKIGAIASLTGRARELGKNWLNGAELAASELKAQGVKLELIVEDDGTNPSKLARAFHKLSNIDKVDAIIGGTFDYLAETAYPLAAQYKIPFVTPTNPVEALSEAALQNPWIFTNGLSLKAEQEAIGSFLRLKKVKTLSFAAPNIPFGLARARMMDDLARKLKLQVYDRIEFELEGYPDNVKLMGLKASQRTPDLFYGVFDIIGTDLFASELERFKLEPIFLSYQHLDQALALSKNKSKFHKSFGVYPRVNDGEFVTRFMKRFEFEPKVYAAQGYDALSFLVKAIQGGVDFSNPSTRFEYKGVTGLHSLPSSGRSLVWTEAQIMTAQNGVFEAWSEGS